MFNRGLFATGPTAITTFTSTSHRFLSGNFLGLSSRLCNTIVMQLQNRVLQNSPATFLCFSPYVTGEKFVNLTDIKLKRVKVTCTLKAGNSIFFRPFSSHADVSWSALRVRFPCASIGMNILHDKPSGIYSTRYFSSDSTKNEKSFKGFHKFWRNGKWLNHKKNFEGKSGSKDTDMITSSDYSVQDVKKDTGLDSSSHQASKNEMKAKMLAKSKTSEEKPSAEVQKQKKPTPKNKNPTSSASENMSKTNCASSVSAKKTNKRETTTKEVIQDTTTKQVDTKVTKNGAILEAHIPKKPTKKQAKPKKEAMKPTEAVIVHSKLNKDHKRMKPLYPPIGKSVVIVESLTKSKVIQGYLGEMYEVIPSYGHVRDLAARSGSVRPKDDFSMVWEVPSAAWTHLKSIKIALAGTQNLILASDPDREGEAIAWHIIEMLQQQDALLGDISIYRVVFNEITESSIKLALQNPREIDSNMVHAYLARRALDYLIGFNISPLLWKILPGCQSAGRVQSAALALICDREMEIDKFKPQEYWSVEVEFNKNGQKIPISSHLTHLNSKKLTQFSITSDKEAKHIKSKIKSSKFQVLDSKRSTIRKIPPSPYITSTLQQDAANKLQFSATYTMKLAQKLYEGMVLPDGRATGLITYPRTDGLHVSDQAANDIHALVKGRYCESFASKTPRKYFKKVKNAQEAHEAIRPTDIRKIPANLVQILDEDSLKLYTLIWSRTVACQMEPSLTEILQIDIGDSEKSVVLRSSCSKTTFLGFRAAYEDQVNEGQDRTNSVFDVLDELKKGDPLSMQKLEPKQHHTQPPVRYSEGSLVKKLEELGIGRPSTYASTIKVLQDRNYVTIKSRALHPEFRGRMVSAFLSHHFTEVTEYSFTADMETELDNISAGLADWKGLLRDYWTRFSKYCERASQVHIHQVEKMLEKTFEDFIFGCLPNNGNRVCPSCREGTLIFKVSRFSAGYIVGCDKHPSCKYIAKTIYGDEEEEDEPFERSSVEEPKVLGLNPGSEEKILLKCGPYGYYIQLGEDRKGYLPKRASLSQVKTSGNVTLEDALDLLRYPITLGKHPVDGHPVILKLAKFGFSIRHRRTNASVPKNMNPRDVTFEEALKLLSGKDVTKTGRPKTIPKVEQEAF